MYLDSRKRPHIDEEDDTPSNKKRATASSNGTPQSNGVADDEPSLDNLELFRKEAIFRRMRHYSRENERSQARIAELEHRKNTCEAGYAAIVACWSQLIETIRLLVKPEDLPQVNLNTEDLFDLARHLPEQSSQDLIAALEDKANASRILVGSFVRLGEQSPSRLFNNNNYLEAQKNATTVAALRSEVAHLNSQLQETRSERESYYKKLVHAENRYERAHSKTVQALEARKAKSAQRDGTEELQQKPSSPSHSPTPSPAPVNGVHDTHDTMVLEQQIKHRENKIIELERQVASVHDQCIALKTEIRLKESGENVFESNAYKEVVTFALKLDADVGEKYKQVMVLEEEVARLTANMERHDEELLAGTSKQLQELQTMLQKRDADNARLREQRDQQNAELVERRHRDSVKTSSSEQLKFLADSRAERISQLELEIGRCKAHLAAHTGDKQLLLTFLLGDDHAKERYQILQEQLKQAEYRTTALEQTIASYGEDTEKHAEYQAVSYQKILELTEELKTYRALVGSSSPELSDLMRALREKEEEVEKLRLLELQRGEAEKSLYSELEKLSSAWEALDRQVKSKVFDLSAMEERLSKNAMDKAKAENKFYAAMRDKEAMEIEKKSFMRMLEKQGKAVEKLVDTEGSLQAQINLLEKEIATQKKIIESTKETYRVQEKTIAELYSRVEVERYRTEHLKNAYKDSQQEQEGKRAELRQLEDELIRSKRDLERHTTRVKETGTTTESSEAENLKSILKCSTCRINFRSTVITKCMHTFCKDCVDKRIQTRQRKCPACNVSFAQSEVQQIWFQ